MVLQAHFKWISLQFHCLLFLPEYPATLQSSTGETQPLPSWCAELKTRALCPSDFLTISSYWEQSGVPWADFKAQSRGTQRNPLSLLLLRETKSTEQTGCAESSRMRPCQVGRAAVEGPWAEALACLVNHAQEKQAGKSWRDTWFIAASLDGSW